MTEGTSNRIRVTEYLVADLTTNRWRCFRCDAEIADLESNYKTGTMVRARDPHEIHDPGFDGAYTFAPDPDWAQIVEFYCPGCYTMIETEYLPPGYPLTHDIDLNTEALRQRAAQAQSSR
jgi:acetophenone carboxylase